ncbi:helix-turn-helix domain-containing protein [Thalassotalea hakodatensis]|uniref:helix-turn-helix domain-containing protein n=1 Tax=Thalassotalea hakodatensis TaxID=3030492 RepID=UPI0025730833|nr:helix-turn-helix domain-containing protein [Thalassotalea hakodatensis]
MTTFFFHVALTQMLMCALLLSATCHRSTPIKLFILLMFCGSGYLLSTVYASVENNTLLWWLGHMGGNALPGVFWLVSISVFGEQKFIKPWQYVVASLTLAVPLTAKLFELLFAVSLSQYEAIHGLIKYGALLLELVLIGHALFISAVQWRNDLVQDRRYIRGGVITAAGFYIIMVIILEQLLQIEWQGLAYFKGLLLAMLTTAVNYVLFQLKSASLFDIPEKPVSIQRKVSVESKEIQKILQSMEQDKLYRQDGLTIAGLSKHLSIHEYKLRNLINGELCYRNFNDFLNYYRIAEVSEQLTQNDFKTTPVLTLALESGFRSLSSFNKAFKIKHGMTPTEYRKKYVLNNEPT